MSHRPPPPMVACIMLANGREQMVKRSLHSFLAQTYERKHLVILDTGDESAGYFGDYDGVSHHWADLSLQSWSIGRLRNHANELFDSQLIAHWDSDDWSHPRRLEEQVELMHVTGKDAVGYNDMLFWDTRKQFPAPWNPQPTNALPCNEAWLYESHHPTRFLGSSMLYKRKAWEASPFHPDEPNEDNLWWMKNQGRCYAESSISTTTLAETKDKTGRIAIEPRMVCAIHGANTSVAYAPAKRVPAHWRRMPNWDQYCKDVML